MAAARANETEMWGFDNVAFSKSARKLTAVHYAPTNSSRSRGHVQKVRSPITHDARALPAASPRAPASTRASHRTATRSAQARAPPSTSPLERTQPHHRDAHAQPSKQPAHIAYFQSAFAQHTLPWHCTTPLLRASPSPGPCPPSPDRGSAPPPPSRSPALPVNLCATCPAFSSCAHAGAASVRRP